MNSTKALAKHRLSPDLVTCVYSPLVAPPQEIEIDGDTYKMQESCLVSSMAGSGKVLGAPVTFAGHYSLYARS